MDIKVRLLRKRKCFASLDWDEENHKDVWVMSFGSIKKPDTDVEIEFSIGQLKKLREMLNDLYEERKFLPSDDYHAGWC